MKKEKKIKASGPLGQLLWRPQGVSSSPVVALASAPWADLAVLGGPGAAGRSPTLLVQTETYEGILHGASSIALKGGCFHS